MDAHRYRQTKAIVDAALALSDAARAAYVKAAAAGDEALEREALAWLASAEWSDAAGFLEGGAVPDVAHGEVASEARRRYRIERELGRGGMGAVYLAQRADGEFRQRVALKIVHAGVGADPGLARRLREERQILAGLHHPNIAALLDGGTAQDGRPFLVMEFVDGERIDSWCDARGLGLRERVALTIKLCAAVAHAHQNLVVHRDLKPANVLIDEHGEPKLLDFGIAKLLRDSDAATQTATREQRLTYAYASPEQLRGERITTLTDVYSLGVLLYRLLAGEAPFAAQEATVPALARAICEDEPTPPSRRRADEAGRSEVAKLDGLDRDLDAIVMKSLRKLPADRYASAAALGEDLQRYLDGMPVAARRGSAMYAARKFVARHRYAVGALLLFVLLIGAFGLERSRQLAHTRAERDRARAIGDFLIGMIQSGDPAAPFTRDPLAASTLTVREVLDRNATRLAQTAVEDASTRAALLAVMGRAYAGLEQGAAARRYLDAALHDLPPDSDDAVDATLYLSEAWMLDADAERALTLADQALASARRIAPAGSRNEGRALRLRGEILAERGDLPAARRDLEAAYALLVRTAGEDDVYSIGGRLDLARQASREGRFDECVTLGDAAGAAWQRQLGADHLSVLSVRKLRARCLNSLGRNAEAEQELREVLARQRTALGDRSLSVAGTLNDLAVLLTAGSGRDAEAETLLREVVAIYESKFGADSPRSAALYGNLGQAIGAQGRVDEALPLLRRAVWLGASAAPSDAYAFTLNNYALQLDQAGRAMEAEAWFERALAAFETLRHDNPRRAAALTNLGRLLVRTQRPALARPKLESALALRRATLPARHWIVADAQIALSQCLLALGKRDAALALAEPARTLLRAQLGDANRRTRQAGATVAALHHVFVLPWTAELDP